MNPLAKLLIFAVLALSTLTSYGKGKVSAADSLAIDNYIEHIRMYLKQPVVLKMADTLYSMAEKVGDERKQTLALAFKLDYYYFTNQADSMLIMKDIVQDFALKHDQPIYYYFAWQRLITHYIRQNQINFAISELDKMQKYAIEHDYFPGQIDACRMLGRIYNNRSLNHEAAATFENAIYILEKGVPEGVEIVNQYALYMNAAQALLSYENTENVLNYIDKALSLCNVDSQRGPVYVAYCNYYLNSGNIEKAKEYLKKAESIFYRQVSTGSYMLLNQAKSDLAYAEKDYKLADKYIEMAYSSTYYGTIYYLEKSKILSAMGRYKEENDILNQKKAYSDSVRLFNIRNNLNESLVMMDVNRVKTESQWEEIKTKERWLTHLYIALAALTVLVVLTAIALKRALNVNKRLQENERNLSEAIIKMEEVSQIKKLFLQQLSHEIRTPLNAIVGFSYIIAESAKKDSNAITEKSQKLIQIVNQALK